MHPLFFSIYISCYFHFCSSENLLLFHFYFAPVVPQNFPSYFYSKHAPRDPQLLKVDQELTRQILLLSNEPLARVSLFIKMCELQRYQMFSMVLLCLQDFPWKIACLPLQVCSFNCPNTWKSIVLGQKLIVARVQQTSRFLVNINILKWYPSFY